MTKQKKEDTGELMVSIEQFTRTRDSVIMSLTNLQSGLSHVQNGLQEVLRAYITHTASILTGGTGDLDASLQLPSHITAATNAAAETVSHVQAQLNNVAAAAGDAGKKKRKREKKERDPNAPKRPLTAAFLYAQAARPIVKQDLEGSLGPNEKLEPNAVNLEVNKRWNEMPEEDKEKWKASYRDSMEQFKKDVAAYKARVGTDAVIHDEEEASDEAEVGVLDSDPSSEDDDAPALVAKAPSPVGKTPKAKRQKTSQANGASAPVAIAPANSTPVPLPSLTGTRANNAAASAAGETTTAAKNTKKKNTKAPQAIAPAPATPAKEPSPDDTKKKTKSRTTRNTEPEGETPAEAPKATKKRDRSKRKSEGAAA